MFNRIMIALDLAHPESYAKSLPAAVEAARHEHAELHALAVLPDFGMTIVSGFFPKDFQEKARVHVRAELDRMLALDVPKEITLKAHVAIGHPAEEIIAAAVRLKADLIVMSSHPPDELRSLMVGSHAAKVVRHAPMSVLVIRN